MQFGIEPLPCGFIAPFEVSAIGAAIVAGRIIPGDAKRSVLAPESTQESKFQNVTDIPGVLIAHTVSKFTVAAPGQLAPAQH